MLEGGSAAVLHTEDGLDLTAWHAPATGPATGITVLVLPGNAGSRAARVPLARALSAAGFDVLLLDYRGYGGNPGSPTEEGLAADARAAHRHLLAERGVPPHGWCCSARASARPSPPASPASDPSPGWCCAARSPRLADVGAQHYPFLPVRALLRDRFPSGKPSARSPCRSRWSLGTPTRSCRRSRAGPSPPPAGPRTLANYVVPTLRAAAEDAGRQAEVVAALPICVTDNPAKARKTAAKTYAIYGTLPSYRAMLDREGADSPADIAIIGNEQAVTERIEEIQAAGVAGSARTSSAPIPRSEIAREPSSDRHKHRPD